MCAFNSDYKCSGKMQGTKLPVIIANSVYLKDFSNKFRLCVNLASSFGWANIGLGCAEPARIPDDAWAKDALILGFATRDKRRIFNFMGCC